MSDRYTAELHRTSPEYVAAKLQEIDRRYRWHYRQQHQSRRGWSGLAWLRLRELKIVREFYFEGILPNNRDGYRLLRVTIRHLRTALKPQQLDDLRLIAQQIAP